MPHTVTIKEVRSLTHNVTELTTEKPDNYQFKPGQSTEVAINKEGWKEKKRPFSFTSLPEDEYLKFSIKSYRDHDGVTKQIDGLMEGDELIIDDPWGTINYKGKGTFIAGGAGITPFISILKDLERKNQLKDNSLIFSNDTSKDVILESYWEDILGDDFTSTLTQEKLEDYEYGKIDMKFLKEHVSGFSQEFYICGPEQMVKDISELLIMLGANPENITFEKS